MYTKLHGMSLCVVPHIAYEMTAALRAAVISLSSGNLHGESPTRQPIQPTLIEWELKEYRKKKIKEKVLQRDRENERRVADGNK